MRSSNDYRSAESLMTESIDALHASNDLAERALAAAQPGRANRSRRGHARPLAAVIAAALAGALTLGGAGYAVATSDFFAQAFGDHGLGDKNTWSITGDDSNATVYSFTREFDTEAPANVTQSLAEATEAVGYTVSTHGFTLAIESMVLDENGAGAVTFTLSNPDGINATDYGNGELLFDYSVPGVCDIGMHLNDGSDTFVDTRTYFDANSSSDTEIHGTIYFSAAIFGEGNADAFKNGVTWRLVGNTSAVEPGANTTANQGESYEARTNVFTPGKVVETRQFAGENGVVASLSPLSILLNFPITDERPYEAHVSGLSLEMADGTEKTIESNAGNDGGATVANSYLGCMYQSDTYIELAHVLTQLADVDNVASVVVSERLYETEVATDGQIVQTDPRDELETYSLVPTA